MTNLAKLTEKNKIKLHESVCFFYKTTKEKCRFKSEIGDISRVFLKGFLSPIFCVCNSYRAVTMKHLLSYCDTEIIRVTTIETKYVTVYVALYVKL